MNTLGLVVFLAVSLTIGASLLAGSTLVPGDRDDANGSAPSTGHVAVSVSIIVPVRDEQATLPLLLASLRVLRTPPTQVLVVDDGSQDATGAVAAAGGARVLVSTPRLGLPPAGWTGKAWACHVGAQAATGRLLLFLDADTVLAPGALDGLLRFHDNHGGLVSVQPFHEPRRAYEQLSGYVTLVSLLGSGAFARPSVRRPLAFGPVLLTSRHDYDRVGGHATVRAEVLDDAGLAAAYHRHHLPVTCALGGSSIRMRMYPGGFRELVRGWSKNVASGATAAAPRPALGATVWIAGHWVVTVGVATWIAQVAHGAPLLTALLWLAAWTATALQLRAMLRRTGSFRWWTWALFPVSLVAFTVLFARSLVLTVVRGRVTWRGREVVTRPGARRSAASSPPEEGT